MNGKCDGCGKSAKLTAIDSGQKLCRACYRELKLPRPKHLATYATLEALARRGVKFSESITREQAARLWTDAGDLHYFIVNVWYAEHGKSPEDAGVSPGQTERLSLQILLDAPALGQRLAELERQRQAIAYERFAELEHHPELAIDQSERADALRRHPWHLKPAPVRDPDYAALVSMLKRALPSQWGPLR